MKRPQFLSIGQLLREIESDYNRKLIGDLQAYIEHLEAQHPKAEPVFPGIEGAPAGTHVYTVMGTAIEPMDKAGWLTRKEVEFYAKNGKLTSGQFVENATFQILCRMALAALEREG